jgi:hypothetical protein
MAKYTYGELAASEVPANNIEHYTNQLMHRLGALYPDNDRDTTIGELRDICAKITEYADALDTELSHLAQSDLILGPNA